MHRSTRAGLVFVAGVVVAIIAVAIWTALSWRRERRAQCAVAEPLVRERADIEAIRKLAAGRPDEYSGKDAEFLIRQFGSQSDTGRSVKEHLHGDGRALLFQGDNSIMLVYFDRQLRAFRAECFLQ